MKRLLALIFTCLISCSLHAQIVDATVCDILDKPLSFNGKIVRIKGTVSAGFDTFVIKGENCGQKVNDIWLSYPEGTKAKSGPAAVVGIQGASNFTGDARAVQQASVTLDKNKDFKQFDSLLSTPFKSNGMCLGCIRYAVSATLVGRLDGIESAALQRDKAGKIVGLGGFGNLNSYSARLVLTSVSDVSSQELDYSKVITATKGEKPSSTATGQGGAGGGGDDMSGGDGGGQGGGPGGGGGGQGGGPGGGGGGGGGGMGGGGGGDQGGGPGQGGSSDNSDPFAAAHMAARSFGPGNPLGDVLERAVAVYGKQNDKKNTVEVSYGSTAEALTRYEAKGTLDSPDGLLFNCRFNKNRLQGDALTKAVIHLGAHIADIRSPSLGSENAGLFEFEFHGWVRTAIAAIASKQKTLSAPGGYLLWDLAWSSADRDNMLKAALMEYLSKEELLSR